MNTIIYKADSRGHANHGWLNARHTFSFANYHNQDRVNFGALRVLNDDVVAGGTGFDTHPHKDMEIITLPLYGALEHKDSMDNSSVIQAGEIQLMSAGSGVFHSEKNSDALKPLNLFQIWIIPNQNGVEPRYAQAKIDIDSKPNQLVTLVTPKDESVNDLWIHQNAWISMGVFDQNQETEYKIKTPGNGVFIMNIDGTFEVEENKLELRDAIGIWDTPSVKIKSETQHSRILILEVPMELYREN